MTQKWNLQDIRPAEPRRRRPAVNNDNTDVKHSIPSEDYRAETEDLDTIVIKNGNKQRNSNYLILGLVIIAVVGGLFGVSLLFSKTTLTVYPQFGEPNVNAEFTAYPDQRDGQLAYEIMTLTEQGERQVKATGQEEVKQQAKGFIEIVKSTPGTERLIKNTRFRSTNGLIFRIQESIVVPGAVKDSSGKLVPGTIRAEVFADDFGQEYNLASGNRFDVPGFKESNLNELYSSIYAENREAFTGGFSGPKFIIDDGELSTAEQGLQVELRDKLLARIDEERPAEFTAFPGAVAFTYNSLPAVQAGGDMVIIRVEAVLQIPLFNQSSFASYIAEETIPSYAGEPVRITNISDLTFNYKDATTNTTNIANSPSLVFSILGKPQVVWLFDAEQLKRDLAGKSLTAISLVLSGHTGIMSAEISGKPFWKRSFPDNKDDIIVTEVIGTKK